MPIDENAAFGLLQSYIYRDRLRNAFGRLRESARPADIGTHGWEMQASSYMSRRLGTDLARSIGEQAHVAIVRERLSLALSDLTEAVGVRRVDRYDWYNVLYGVERRGRLNRWNEVRHRIVNDAETLERHSRHNRMAHANASFDALAMTLGESNFRMGAQFAPRNMLLHGVVESQARPRAFRGRVGPRPRQR